MKTTEVMMRALWFLPLLFTGDVFGELCPDTTLCQCFHSGSEIRAECFDSTMTHIPDGLPVNLTHLLISGNNITELLSQSVLDTLKSLIKLDIINNPLSSIANGAFNGLVSLRNMTLRNNELTNIQAGLFNSLQQLQHIDIGENELKTVPNVGDPPALTELVLDNNDISDVPANSFVARALKKLNLQNNKIETLHDNSFNVPLIEQLDLSHNNITLLPGTVFASLTQLTQLDLSHNLLSQIPASAFPGSSKLENLLLNNNKITSIAQIRFDFLKHLDVSLNFLTTYPTTVNSYTTLTYLDLSSNLFETLEANLANQLSNLNFLKIGNMPTLVQISSEAFTGLTSLETLVLSQLPSLTYFTPDHVSSLTNLNEIHLSDNGFEYLDERIFTSLQGLRRAHIQGNPFHCNCSISWIARVVHEEIHWANHWKNSATPPKCQTPRHMELLPIPDMYEEDLTCQNADISPESPIRQSYNVSNDATIEANMFKGLPFGIWRAPDGSFVYPPLHDHDNDPRRFVQSTVKTSGARHFVSSILNIRNISFSDAGEYTLIAENIMGNETLTFSLGVMEVIRPIPPTGGARSQQGACFTWATVTFLGWAFVILEGEFR